MSVGHAVVSEVLDCRCRGDQAVGFTSHVNIKDIQSENRQDHFTIYYRNVLQIGNMIRDQITITFPPKVHSLLGPVQ